MSFIAVEPVRAWISLFIIVTKVGWSIKLGAWKSLSVTIGLVTFAHKYWLLKR
jgi:hypothetical protein